ncbi:MAG: DNA topoisomerase [Pseudoflavonifractor sp.]
MIESCFAFIPLSLKNTVQDQHFTQPPSRYTEATLIKALEEKGIGRPSTYAPTISTIMDREYVVKEGKYLRTTPLGEVVTGLMKDKFPDIVDPAFTAHMEERLDDVEAGKTKWKAVLGEFYKGFDAEMKQAELDLDGERIKVPAEVTDVICPLCGKNLEIKSGRFGRFLACPGWPDCSFTQPIVIEMPGRCPKCGGHILKKTSKKGYAYYGCQNSNNKDESKKCDFMTWDVPVKDDCPECGMTMFKRSGKGFKKPFCVNPECKAFLPEDQRGYYKKKTTQGDAEKTEDADQTAPAKKAPAKKAPVKKAPAKKAAVKKPAAKKAPAETEEKAAAKKPAAKKAAVKKPTAKKPAVKKTAAKKAE